MNTSTHYELKHNHFYIFIRICVECYNGGIFSHGQVHHVGLSYIDLLRFATRPSPSCWLCHDKMIYSLAWRNARSDWIMKKQTQHITKNRRGQQNKSRDVFLGRVGIVCQWRQWDFHWDNNYQRCIASYKRKSIIKHALKTWSSPNRSNLDHWIHK